jgi:hypothetical protein
VLMVVNRNREVFCWSYRYLFIEAMRHGMVKLCRLEHAFLSAKFRESVRCKIPNKDRCLITMGLVGCIHTIDGGFGDDSLR